MHERSYCPKCNHKLEFLDMIPILSFIFLGGKCRYCKKNIGIRYITLEILTGLSFVILAYALKFNVYNIEPSMIIEFVIGVLYIVFLFLIAGIDLEHNIIDKRVLIYGFTVALVNIVYQYISCLNLNTTYNLTRIIVYLIAIIILNLINISRTKNNKSQYIFDLVSLSFIMSLFTYEAITILTIICTLISVGLKSIINTKQKKKGNMPIAFFETVSNALIIVASLVYTQIF